MFAGDYLVAAFTAMVESPRYKKNQGRDYVFYDSHPGFTAGNAAKQYWSFMCHVSFSDLPPCSVQEVGLFQRTYGGTSGLSCHNGTIYIRKDSSSHHWIWGVQVIESELACYSGLGFIGFRV